MRAVGIEESAAVGAQHLDGFLGCDRSLGDHLVGDRVHYRFAIGPHHWFAVGDSLHLLRFDQLDCVIRFEVLHHALRDQEQRIDDTGRQQHPQSGPGKVDPEIADGVFFRAAKCRE